MAHALGAQPLNDVLGVRAQLVGHHDHTGQGTVDPDKHVRFPEPCPVTSDAAATSPAS